MLDLKVQRKQKGCRNYLNLYVKGAKPNYEANRRLDLEIEAEIIGAKKKGAHLEEMLDRGLLRKIVREVLRDSTEKLLKVSLCNYISLKGLFYKLHLKPHLNHKINYSE